ncbi:MAG TPA: ASCH domain-containing protein [Chloroflexota bacterium]|nr:ASCH domain-containing protein [Chloroflexota bacterium]HUM67784.1 ASCH domain-containing protein [Chloroflexota bacterium]
MLFQYTYQLILNDKKTETRRQINPGEKLLDNPKRVEVNGRVKWQVGRSYAIQPGRSQKAVGRIRITDIKMQPPGQMQTEDARAEGFPSLDDFWQTWLQIHKHFDPDLAFWVITFTREPTPEEKVWAECLDQENWLNQMARKEREKLTAVGHELGEYDPTFS